MTLRNLSDKEIKTINGGRPFSEVTFCGYKCGFPFILTNTILYTLENVKDIFARIGDLMPLMP